MSLDIINFAELEDIPPIFIKHCAIVLAQSFTILFNNLLLNGHFSSKWKESYTTSIFKNCVDTDVKKLSLDMHPIRYHKTF